LNHHKRPPPETGVAEAFNTGSAGPAGCFVSDPIAHAPGLYKGGTSRSPIAHAPGFYEAAMRKMYGEPGSAEARRALEFRPARVCAAKRPDGESPREGDFCRPGGAMLNGPIAHAPGFYEGGMSHSPIAHAPGSYCQRALQSSGILCRWVLGTCWFHRDDRSCRQLTFSDTLNQHPIRWQTASV